MVSQGDVSFIKDQEILSHVSWLQKLYIDNQFKLQDFYSTKEFDLLKLMLQFNP